MPASPGEGAVAVRVAVAGVADVVVQVLLDRGEDAGAVVALQLAAEVVGWDQCLQVGLGEQLEPLDRWPIIWRLLNEDHWFMSIRKDRWTGQTFQQPPTLRPQQ